MIYPDDEVAAGIERLGRYPETKYLAQVLLKAVLMSPGETAPMGTVHAFLGRSIFAADLIKALKLDARNDGPDAAELIRGPDRERSAPERGHVRRRLPPSE